MRRSSLESLSRDTPGLRKLVHECWGCHTIGLIPGIVDSKHGDYGMRDLVKKYTDLPLDSQGLCERCAASPPVDIGAR